MESHALSRRGVLTATGTAVVGSVAGCLGVGSGPQTEGEILRVNLLAETISEADISNQRVLTLDSEGLEISEYVADEYDVHEDEFGDEPVLRDLPLGSLYGEFDQFVCETIVELGDEDTVNDVPADEVQVYNAYGDLFDHMDIGTAYRLLVGEPQNRHAIDHPRINDVAPI